MTRPRIIGSVVSCISALVVLVMLSAETPTITSAAPNSHQVGITAASARPMPNTAEPTITIGKRGLSRPAASSAPMTVPTAIVELRMP